MFSFSHIFNTSYFLIIEIFEEKKNLMFQLWKKKFKDLVLYNYKCCK